MAITVTDYASNEGTVALGTYPSVYKGRSKIATCELTCAGRSYTSATKDYIITTDKQSSIVVLFSKSAAYSEIYFGNYIGSGTEPVYLAYSATDRNWEYGEHNMVLLNFPYSEIPFPFGVYQFEIDCILSPETAAVGICYGEPTTSTDWKVIDYYAGNNEDYTVRSNYVINNVADALGLTFFVNEYGGGGEYVVNGLYHYGSTGWGTEPTNYTAPYAGSFAPTNDAGLLCMAKVITFDAGTYRLRFVVPEKESLENTGSIGIYSNDFKLNADGVNFEQIAGGNVNIGGAWKQLAGTYVNIGGSWKTVTNKYVNINGSWKPVV